MALEGKGTRITMNYGDYGIQLPFDITDIDYEEGDIILFELRKSTKTGVILAKEYKNQETTEGIFRFFLEFTKKESEGLYPGNYVYYLRHIRDGEIKDTLVSGESFKINR